MQKWLLAVFSVVLALVFVEAGFRWVGRARNIDFRLYSQELKNSNRLPKGLFRPDPLLITRLVPNAHVLATTSDFSVQYRINSQGLRERETEVRPSRRKKRLLAFGDSFTFGEGVPHGERFTDVLADRYPDWEIINCGVSGYGLDQEALFFTLDGAKYKPDVVALFINWVSLTRERIDLAALETGIPVASTAARPTVAAGTAYVRSDDRLFETRAPAWRRVSYLSSYLHYRWTLYRLKSVLESEDRRTWKSRASGNTSDEKRQKYARHVQERTTKILRHFMNLARAGNFRLVVVNIDPSRPFPYLSQLEKEGMVYLDLSPDLVRHSRTQRLGFVYDRHYNPATHRRIGTMVAERLRPYLQGSGNDVMDSSYRS